jgi:hypothetical protein
MFPHDDDHTTGYSVFPKERKSWTPNEKEQLTTFAFKFFMHHLNAHVNSLALIIAHLASERTLSIAIPTAVLADVVLE